MTGSWLMFGIFRQSAKKSMQCYIHSSASKKDKVEFLITHQNSILFSFDNDGDELNYQGIMYDIINKKQGTDTLHVTCLMDDDETALISNYYNLQGKCVQKNDHGSINHFHIFYSVYEPSSLNIQFNNYKTAQIKILVFIDASIYNAIFSIVKPPPKFLA